MMMRTLATFFLAIGCFMLSAQIIEDKTEVLDAKRGVPLFELDSGVPVYSYSPDGSWYKVRKEAYVKPASLADEKYLAAETELRNKEGKVIGRTLAEVKVVEASLEKAFRGDSDFRVILEGWLFKTAFADGSAPEERISSLLQLKNRTQQQEGFRQLFSDYSFEERDFEDLTVYAMREQDKTLAEEKDFRLIMIFRGETPYAVISNAHHNITAPKVKQEWSEEPFMIWYLYKPTSSQAELIQDRILYTYLAL